MVFSDRGSRPDWVLFEDDHCLVANKPAGLATQGRAGEDSLEARVKRLLDPDDPTRVFLGIPQRLDRPVSGVLLFAKTPKAARRLAEQFASRAIRKEYWAVVEGRPEPAEGTWDDCLLEKRGNDPPATQVVAEGTPKARKAITRYRRDAGDRLSADLSQVRLWPETGRRHQLRAQLSARGSPIVGDALYGAHRSFGGGIALHARSLRFMHPSSRATLTILADPPTVWVEAGFDFARSA